MKNIPERTHRCACGKIAYQSRAHALKALRTIHIRQRVSHVRRGTTCHIREKQTYRCDESGCFHLTSHSLRELLADQARHEFLADKAHDYAMAVRWQSDYNARSRHQFIAAHRAAA